MSIRYLIGEKRLVIDDIDRLLLRDGTEEYYATPRDMRPCEVNPYDIENISQVYYMFERLARDNFGLNAAPTELIDCLDTLKELCGITEDVAKHCLAIIVNPIKEKNKP